MNIKETVVKTGQFLFKNRARVLTAVGVGCNALAVYFAWKNAPRAIVKMEDERDRVNNEASIACEADILKSVTSRLQKRQSAHGKNGQCLLHLCSRVIFASLYPIR